MDALSYHASAQKPVSRFLVSHSESRECHGAQGDPHGPLRQLPSHYTGLTSDHHPCSVYSRRTCPCAVPLTCQGPSSLSQGELFSPWPCTQLTHLPLPRPCSRITFSVRWAMTTPSNMSSSAPSALLLPLTLISSLSYQSVTFCCPRQCLMLVWPVCSSSCFRRETSWGVSACFAHGHISSSSNRDWLMVGTQKLLVSKCGNCIFPF